MRNSAVETGPDSVQFGPNLAQVLVDPDNALVDIGDLRFRRIRSTELPERLLRNKGHNGRGHGANSRFAGSRGRSIGGSPGHVPRSRRVRKSVPKGAFRAGSWATSGATSAAMRSALRMVPIGLVPILRSSGAHTAPERRHTRRPIGAVCRAQRPQARPRAEASSKSELCAGIPKFGAPGASGPSLRPLPSGRPSIALVQRWHPGQICFDVSPTWPISSQITPIRATLARIRATVGRALPKRPCCRSALSPHAERNMRTQ